jgi:glycine oxidase
VQALKSAAPEHPVLFKMLGSLLLAHQADAGSAKRVVDLLICKTPSDYSEDTPQPLTIKGLQQLEPTVRACPHAWLLPNEGQIDTVQAMTALGEAATKLGVTWRWGETVTTLNAGEIDSTPFGLSERSTLKCDWVFDVRGTGAKPDVSVRGVRGEIFWLYAPQVKLQRPIRLLHPRHRVYLVPRDEGRIVVGASEIESEDRSPISLRSTVELLAAAHSVIPELAEARIIHSETNLRPALPDNLPLMLTIKGITRINGLFRHGWLIAPALVESAIKGMNESLDA